MTKSVLVSTVRKLVQENVGGSVARGFNFQVGIRVGPTFAVMLLLFAAVCSVSLVLAQFDGNPHNWDRLRRCDHSGYSPPCGACEGVGGIVTSDTADDITIVPCKIEASSENPVRPIWGDPFTELASHEILIGKKHDVACFQAFPSNDSTSTNCYKSQEVQLWSDMREKKGSCGESKPGWKRVGSSGERHLDDLPPGCEHVDREPVASLRHPDNLHHSEVRW